MGRPVTEGQTDGDVPRLFAPHRYGQVVGRAYREAVHAIVLNTWSPRAMQQLHTVLCSMRNVRTGLAAGERVPEYLALSNFHAHIVLSNIFKKQHEFESAPLEQLVRVFGVPAFPPLTAVCAMMLLLLQPGGCCFSQCFKFKKFGSLCEFPCIVEMQPILSSIVRINHAGCRRI